MNARRSITSRTSASYRPTARFWSGDKMRSAAGLRKATSLDYTELSGAPKPFDQLHLAGMIDRVAGDAEHQVEPLGRRERRAWRDGLDRRDQLGKPSLLGFE